MPRATAKVLAVAFGLVAMTSSTALARGLIAPEGGADLMPSDRNAIRAVSSSVRQLRKRTTKSSWFSSTCHTSREVLHSKSWSTFVTMGGGSLFPKLKVHVKTSRSSVSISGGMNALEGSVKPGDGEEGMGVICQGLVFAE